MSIDSVRVTEQTTTTDAYGNRAHYEVSFERREAVSGTSRSGRVRFQIRCNGIVRLEVELPGEVGLAMFYATRQAYEKFDIESMTGNKVSL